MEEKMIKVGFDGIHRPYELYYLHRKKMTKQKKPTVYNWV